MCYVKKHFVTLRKGRRLSEHFTVQFIEILRRINEMFELYNFLFLDVHWLNFHFFNFPALGFKHYLHKKKLGKCIFFLFQRSLLALAASFISHKRSSFYVLRASYFYWQSPKTEKASRKHKSFTSFPFFHASSGGISCRNCYPFQVEVDKYQMHNKNFTDGFKVPTRIKWEKKKCL